MWMAWAVPLLLLVLSLIESIVWEFRINWFAAIHCDLLALVFAVLINAFSPGKKSG